MEENGHLPGGYEVTVTLSLSEDSVGYQLSLQYGDLLPEESWSSGMVDNFTLTLSITKDPKDGKFCSHSTTLMITSLLNPSKKDSTTKPTSLNPSSFTWSQRTAESPSVLSEGHKGLERGSFLISFPRHVLTSEISREEASVP